MASDYDDRTSLNTYRSVGATLGIFVAVGMRGLAEDEALGSLGWAGAGVVYGIIVAVPWFWVHRVSFERPGFRREENRSSGLIAGLLTAVRQRTFARLVALYLCGRLAMDLVGAMLILYFTFWLGRTGDFELAMLLFLLAAIVGLPFWLKFSVAVDKKTAFVLGSLIWAGIQAAMFLIEPDWPRWVGLAAIVVAGFGFAAVDMMPWSMVGDVIDEDDLATGERREGLYNGLLMFLRKLAGAVAVFLAMATLDLAGFQEGSNAREEVLLVIRSLATLAPSLLLLVGLFFALRYPLSRDRHREIVEQLAARDRQRRR